jgi:hypothetical protein
MGKWPLALVSKLNYLKTDAATSSLEVAAFSSVETGNGSVLDLL